MPFSIRDWAFHGLSSANTRNPISSFGSRCTLVSQTTILQSFFFSFFSVNEKTPASELTRLQILFSRCPGKAVLLAPERGRVQVGAGMTSNDAMSTHIQKNLTHYARIHPDLFPEG